MGAREEKAKQVALLQDALNHARGSSEVEMLDKVLERAQRVATQLDSEYESDEVVRRQCVQERELNCAMSCASFGDREDSSGSGGGRDVANLRDLDGLDPAGSGSDSAPSSPMPTSSGRTPAHSPRPRARTSAAAQQNGSGNTTQTRSFFPRGLGLPSFLSRREQAS